MSFGAEFKNMRAAGGAPKITESVAKEAEIAAAEKASAPPPESQPEEAVYAQPFIDGQTLGETAPHADGLPPIIPAPKPEAKKTIRMNGKTFDSTEEALEYAAQIERDLEKKEAYAKGLEDSKPKAATAAEVKKIKKIADKLFEDPDAAMEELENHILEMADKRIADRESVKSQEQQQIETRKQTWDNFYKTNSDLADWQDEVNLVTQKEWDRLQHLPAQEGLEEIANLARNYVASVKERALPKSTLASRPAQTSSPGGKAATTTTQPATEKKVSFSQQVRSTNKRTAMQGEV